MKRQIPNILTCFNLLTGTVAILLALRDQIEMASLLLILAAIFDFLDGFSARLLNAQSVIGPDLDSLADLVSFGVAPAMIVLVWSESCFLNLPPYLQTDWIYFLRYIIFLNPILAAVRLAKFNHDERQKEAFIGLATPANAFFLGFIPYAAEELTLLGNYWVVLSVTLIFSLLLVANIQMFSLKFTNFRFKENLIRYIFLFLSLILLILFRLGSFPVIILMYILLSFGIRVFQPINRS
ncbi:MAG TPA: CDP-alcohol phosphatidyltransferase family protein [Bacteroidales bacterium]|nr:CDP-alcohol phosphatidyltransferase family protein [Bacteroidales bacterium]HOH21972.1 CDP-alcohol phosphatidyltransferase family protein [Bacteroidales bacterium]HPZ03497.1 CDP-alcohol phosphatidyltransferase family protein [Bacteroidales bacterium]HQB74893.1 CDP-alcohol phosphatidyltransferase family protein [Bacteroidales bacterium]